MAIWKDLVKCVVLSVVFLLVCIFVLWPSNQELQGDTNIHNDTFSPGEEYNSATTEEEPQIDNVLDTIDEPTFPEFLLEVEHSSTTNVPMAPKTVYTNVTTTAGFQVALTNAVPGTIIHLATGIYHGEFTLTSDDVVLKGTDQKTIFQLKGSGTGHTSHATVLRIQGNNCEVRDLKLISDQSDYTMGFEVKGQGNKLTHIHLEGFSYGVVAYSDNVFSDISIKKGSGFHIAGNNTSLTRIDLENISKYGIEVVGNNNSIQSLTCDNCKVGIYVTGNDNKISHVNIRNSINPEIFWKLSIRKGDRNLVDQFTCDDSCLLLESESTNSEVRNSTCDKVEVEGTGQSLVNVDAGKQLEVEGSGHRIENSKADKFINWGVDLTLIGNHFGEITTS